VCVLLDTCVCVCSKVQLDLQEVHESLAKASRPNCLTTRKEIDVLLADVRTTMSRIRIGVKDLSQTIEVVEENRLRFSFIHDRELDNRRSFVMDARASVSRYEDQIRSLQYREKETATESTRKTLISHSSNRINTATVAAAHRNENFVQQSQISAQRQVKQEDEVLVDMHHALNRLQHLGQTINTQLVTQEQ
jgi:hypothetical protein